MENKDTEPKRKTRTKKRVENKLQPFLSIRVIIKEHRAMKKHNMNTTTNPTLNIDKCFTHRTEENRERNVI